MREILFRGKRVDNGEWVEGFYSPIRLPIVGEIGHFINEDGYQAIEIKKETVCEYTGLTDKNGVKIFEGDIMVFLKGATRHFKIAWDNMGWKMYRADGTRIRFTWECDEMQYICSSEVIGNIHDNLELLTGE